MRGCLIADRDGVYNPATANGRLLLGLKGTISELELHTIRSRLTAGLLAKAERGELALIVARRSRSRPLWHRREGPEPGGAGAALAAVRDLPEVRSVAKVMREFNGRDLDLPRRDRHGDLHWAQATIRGCRSDTEKSCLCGSVRLRTNTTTDNSTANRQLKAAKPIEEWRIVVKDRYPAYIDWKTYEKIRCIATTEPNTCARRPRGAAA